MVREGRSMRTFPHLLLAARYGLLEQGPGARFGLRNSLRCVSLSNRRSKRADIVQSLCCARSSVIHRDICGVLILCTVLLNYALLKVVLAVVLSV